MREQTVYVEIKNKVEILPYYKERKPFITRTKQNDKQNDEQGFIFHFHKNKEQFNNQNCQIYEIIFRNNDTKMKLKSQFEVKIFEYIESILKQNTENARNFQSLCNQIEECDNLRFIEWTFIEVEKKYLHYVINDDDDDNNNNNDDVNGAANEDEIVCVYKYYNQLKEEMEVINEFKLKLQKLINIQMTISNLLQTIERSRNQDIENQFSMTHFYSNNLESFNRFRELCNKFKYYYLKLSSSLSSSSLFLKKLDHFHDRFQIHESRYSIIKQIILEIKLEEDEDNNFFYVSNISKTAHPIDQSKIKGYLLVTFVNFSIVSIDYQHSVRSTKFDYKEEFKNEAVSDGLHYVVARRLKFQLFDKYFFPLGRNDIAGQCNRLFGIIPDPFLDGSMVSFVKLIFKDTKLYPKFERFTKEDWDLVCSTSLKRFLTTNNIEFKY